MLLRDKVRIRERWSVVYNKLLNTTSQKLDPTIIDLLPPRPLKLSLGDEPSTIWTKRPKHSRAYLIGKQLLLLIAVLLGQMASRPKCSKHQPPFIRPVLSRHPCQRLGMKKIPPAMEKCDDQGPTQNEGPK